MNARGQLLHVGSSSPLDPRKKSPKGKNGLVLDIMSNYNEKRGFAPLVLSRSDPQRELTQTWNFDVSHFILDSLKLFCCTFPPFSISYIKEALCFQCQEWNKSFINQSYVSSLIMYFMLNDAWSESVNELKKLQIFRYNCLQSFVIRSESFQIFRKSLSSLSMVMNRPIKWLDPLSGNDKACVFWNHI